MICLGDLLNQNINLKIDNDRFFLTFEVVHFNITPLLDVSGDKAIMWNVLLLLLKYLCIEQ